MSFGRGGSSPLQGIRRAKYFARRFYLIGICRDQLAYQTGLAAFGRFRAQYSLPSSWPASEQQIVLFIAFCYEMGYSPKTISTYLAGVSYFHKLHGVGIW